jgi:hypothetical protein
MPDEKGIKQVIADTYNTAMPALVEKIRVESKSVSLTTDM